MSRKTVTEWKKRGWLVFSGDEIEPEASDAMLRKYRKGGSAFDATSNTEALPGPAGTPKVTESADVLPAESNEDTAAKFAAGKPMTLDETKLMKETYLAKLAQLDYDQKSGRVVDATAVAEVVGNEYAIVRTKLLAIPAEQAPRLKRCRTTAELQDNVVGINCFPPRPPNSLQE